MATRTRYINLDLAKVYRDENGKRKFLRGLAWGDAVRVRNETAEEVEIDFDGAPAFLPKRKGGPDVVVDKKDSRVLKVDFIDIQQGDGSVIETPDGKVILIDGGDNQLFARYLAARFRGSSDARPKEIDCILVTHGDADHFVGMTKIYDSEELEDARKRLFIHPRRVYHNGLVKRPSKKNGKKRPDEEMLGDTRTVDGRLVITGLENDLLKVEDSEMNEPFLKWKAALKQWKKRGPIDIRRLAIGDHDAFDFLRDEDIDVQVLGPITLDVKGKPALPFLGNPPKGPRIGHDSLSLAEEGFSGKSASHTINGHSVIFRLTYGQFNLLFTGDLNDESSRALAREHNRGKINLRAEVFKVPHHGSADFSGAFIQAVSPVVSVISSGDESAKKEYVHPRATIMGTLGKYSRVEEPLIFCTELVAFFSLVGTVERMKPKKGEDPLSNRFTAFERSSFGIVKVRTDGQRLLVYTNSGKKDMWEAYAYTIDDYGKPSPAPVRT
jgi:glyoxylase-like metal-dependent hydrolase (beta-lactamase superfamily II)